jgi:hypothetical protein
LLIDSLSELHSALPALFGDTGRFFCGTLSHLLGILGWGSLLKSLVFDLIGQFLTVIDSGIGLVLFTGLFTFLGVVTQEFVEGLVSSNLNGS